jgi:hypothetical protein
MRLTNNEIYFVFKRPTQRVQQAITGETLIVLFQKIPKHPVYGLLV